MGSLYDAVKGINSNIAPINTPNQGGSLYNAVKNLSTAPQVLTPKGYGVSESLVGRITPPQQLQELADAQSKVESLFKNPLGGNIIDAAKSFVSAIDSSFTGAENAWQDLFNAFKKAPTEPIKAAGETYKAGAELIGGVFAPISTLLTTASKLPVVGKTIDVAINMPYQVGGAIGGTAFDTILNKLPINEKTKNDLRDGVDAIGELAGQMAVGAIQGGGFFKKKSAVLEEVKIETPELKTEISKVPVQKAKELETQFGKEDAKTIVKKAAEVAQKQVQEKVGGVPEIPKELQPLVKFAKEYPNSNAFISNIKASRPVFMMGNVSFERAFNLQTEAVKNAGYESLVDFYNKTTVKIKPAITAIPQELQPLAQEARKYKSAEEFVKSQNEIAIENLDNIRNSGFEHTINENGTLTLYHKTTPLAASNIERTGKFSADSFFADSPEVAQELAGVKKGGSKVIEIRVDPKDVWFNQGTYEFEATEPLIKGRDGIYRAKGSLTKSQLTDFYNQAVKGVGEVEVSEEKLRSIYREKPDEVKQALEEVIMELEGSVPGERLFIRNPVGPDEVIGISSSFPDWIPEDLRSTKLFRKVLSGLQDIGNIKFPEANRTKLRELYNVLLDEVDNRVGLDTKNIRDAIIELYDQRKTTKIEGGISSRIEGGEANIGGKITIPEPKETKGIVELTSGINPNLDKFIEQDIKPATKTVIGGVVKVWDSFKKAFAPAIRGEEAIKTASILRESLGRMARRKETTYQTLLKSRKIFDRYTSEQSIAFIDKLEKGEPIKGAEQFTQVMRDALDSRWKQIQDIKGIDAYIENYFPHIWEDVAKAKNTLSQFFGKRPFEGTKAYLKQRTIPTIKEGIDLGLKPISYNPVDLIMARIVDMDKFLMANDVWTQFKEQGLRKFVKFGDKPPQDWRMINDKIAHSFQFSPTEKGMILRGNWYMPETAAAVINNYLSPGLRGNPLYNAFRMGGNLLNQVQLGLSGFHALFTSADAVISKGALELQKATPIGISKTITAPITAPYYLFENIIRGNKLLKDYFRQNPEIPQLVNALERAGGRVKMDRFYLNNATENFMKALRSGNVLGSIFRAPGALIETIARPLMQELVPRQKLGIFSDGAKFILEKAQEENWSEYKTTLRLQEMWDSVDNRMGQLVYDNLFWDKVLKDVGLASVRSLGWNLGTIRELGGGLLQIAKTPFQLFTKTGRANMRLTPKMAYTLTLPYVVGVWGGIIYYLYNGKAPETLLDYYYPKTGKQKIDGTDERITLPSYMKDVFAYKTEPGQTVLNKLHPELATIIDMFQNQDYYGTEIRNPNDPIVKQAKDLFAYQATQFVPFSITNMIQRQKTGGSWGSYLQSFTGITPAPGYITRTPLQTEIYDLYDKRFGGGVQTKEQADISKQKSEVRNLYLEGKIDEANQKLKVLVDKGIVKNVNEFVFNADIPNDIKLFQQLPIQDQEALIKKMELYQLNRYAWYVKLDLKAKFSTLSDNAKNFVEMWNRDEVKEPIWKKGQLVQ